MKIAGLNAPLQLRERIFNAILVGFINLSMYAKYYLTGEYTRNYYINWTPPTQTTQDATTNAKASCWKLKLGVANAQKVSGGTSPSSTRIVDKTSEEL